MKELSAIEKLEAVKAIMEIMGYDFSDMTVSETLNLFVILRDEIGIFMSER
jgi:hypothetical protein